MHQVMRTTSAMSREVSSVKLSWHFAAPKKGGIIHNEGFNNLTSRRVGVIIYLWLGCLHVFAHAGTNVAAESHYVQEKAVVRIWVVGRASGLLDLGKDALLRGLRCVAMFSSLMRLSIRTPTMLFLLFTSTGGLNARKMKKTCLWLSHIREGSWIIGCLCCSSSHHSGGIWCRLSRFSDTLHWDRRGWGCQ